MTSFMIILHQITILYSNKISENANPNYLATICMVGEIHTIEGADKIQDYIIKKAIEANTFEDNESKRPYCTKFVYIMQCQKCGKIKKKTIKI